MGSLGVVEPVKYPLPLGSLQVPLRIPVPGLDRQLGILAIGHRLPARGEHSFQCSRREVMIDGLRRNTVNSRTQSLIRHKVIG